MNFSKHHSTLPFVAASLMAAVACRAVITTGDNTPLLGNSEFILEIEQPICMLPAMPGNPPAGSCIKLTFIDGDGNVIGEAEATVGGSGVEAPVGTEDILASACDPESDEPGGEPVRKRLVQPIIGGVRVERHGYRLVPYDIEGGSGRYASFEVLAGSKSKADVISSDFVKGMLLEAPPPQVIPDAIVRANIATDGTVVVSMFTEQAPESLAFRWNDAVAIGLESATVTFSNGWFMTTVSIPASKVDYSPLGSTNRFEYEIALPGRDVGTSLELTVEP